MPARISFVSSARSRFPAYAVDDNGQDDDGYHDPARQRHREQRVAHTLDAASGAALPTVVPEGADATERAGLTQSADVVTALAPSTFAILGQNA